MSRGTTRGDIPVPAFEPGTSVLVAGPITSAARELALTLAVSGESPSGSVIASTNTDGETLLNQCEALSPGLDRASIRIVDATGGDTAAASPEWLRRVSTPGNLSALGMELSAATDELAAADLAPIRTGVCSVSGLLEVADFRPVSRLIHLLVGRVDAIGGVGVFYVDTATCDERVTDTLAKLCDGRIDVREARDRGDELQVQGLPGAVDGWRAFRISLQWPRGIGKHLIARQMSSGDSVTRLYSCIRCEFSSTDDLDPAALTETACR
ncbi:MAG: hypothetical protein ABEH66_08445 [Halobacteriales archaeon]